MSESIEWLLKIVAFISFGILLVLLAIDLNVRTFEMTLCAIVSLSSVLLIKNKRRS